MIARDREQDAGIAGDADIGGVAERHHAAEAEHQVEAQRQDREDQALARHVDVEIMRDDARQRDQRERRDRKRDEVAAAHNCTRPNRPCGRNTSTSTIGRNSTK